MNWLIIISTAVIIALTVLRFFIPPKIMKIDWILAGISAIVIGVATYFSDLEGDTWWLSLLLAVLHFSLCFLIAIKTKEKKYKYILLILPVAFIANLVVLCGFAGGSLFVFYLLWLFFVSIYTPALLFITFMIAVITTILHVRKKD